MSEELSFRQLIQQVRQGDAQAAADLIHRYENDLRIIARVRLRSTGMQRTLESMDICQSVLGNFFVRVTSGEFDLQTPEDVIKLLSRMIRNKVTDKYRLAHAEKRPQGGSGTPIEDLQIAGGDHTPSQIVSVEELRREFIRRLTPEEREIWERRQEGQGWDDIAKAVGRKVDTLRMQLGGASKRIGTEMGLDELTDNEED